MRFAIVINSPPDRGNGGVCACYQLADALRARGQDVVVSVQTDHTLHGFEDDGRIVILPEIYHALPPEFRTVRWILNRPEVFGNAHQYAGDDLVFLWSKAYRYPAPQGIAGLLFTPNGLPRPAFVDRGEPRHGTCYLVRKGRAKPLDQHPDDAIRIDDLVDAGDDEALADVFNRCQRFISYDHATAISLYAALCGCESIVVPDGVRNAQQAIADDALGLAGVAWGFDDLHWAKASRAGLSAAIARLQSESSASIDAFLEICRAKWEVSPTITSTNKNMGHGRTIGICTPMPLDETPSGKHLPLLRGEWHRARMALICPTGHATCQIHVDGMEIGEARNQAVRIALREKIKYLFFLDWDVILAPSSLLRLAYIADNYPQYDVISGLYTTRCHPAAPLLWQTWGDGVSWDWTLGESIECVGVPMGCTLIRTSVFERLDGETKPWFKTVDEIATQTMSGRTSQTRAMGTEDLYFCKRLTEEIGGKILCDTGVLCGHQDRDTGEIFMLPESCLPARRWQEQQAKGKESCGSKT